MSTADDNVARVAAEWQEIGLATGIGDHTAGERAAADAYRMAGLAVPERIVWVASIWAGLNMAAAERFDLDPGKVPTGEQLRTALGDVAYGQPDAPWLAKCDYILRFEPATHEHYAEAQRVEPIVRLARSVSWW